MASKKESTAKKNAVKEAKPSKAEDKKIIPLPGEKKASRFKIPKIKAASKKEVVQETGVIRDDPYSILKFVLMTEKSVRMVEAQNKLVFIVDRRYNKKEIKQAAEVAFESEIEKVNVSIDQKGRKKAYIKFVKPGQAGDIAVRLGII